VKTAYFHLGDLLTVTSGRLMSPSGVDGAYAILTFMTQDTLSTHQLPRAARECKPHLVEMYPWLAEIELSEVTPDNWRAVLDILVNQYGVMHEVKTLTPREHIFMDPIMELGEMVGDKPIIIANIGDEDAP